MTVDTIIKNRLLVDDKYQRRLLRLLGQPDSDASLAWLTELDHYEYYFQKFDLIENAIRAELESMQSKSTELASYSAALVLEMSQEKEKITAEKSKIESKKALNEIADDIQALPNRSILAGNILALESDIADLEQALASERSTRSELKLELKELIKTCLVMDRKLAL